MIRQTQNRTAILKCLTEQSSDGGLPPYCASDIFYMLEHGFEWYGAKKPVSISQIHRTLRDLMAAGVIVKERRLDEPPGHEGLPGWVNYYQLADAVERNAFLTEINRTLRVAEKCHGTFLFTRDLFFNQPFDAKEKAAVIADIKALIQRSHSDRAAGFEYETKQLNKALKYCRADIDLLKQPNKRLRLNT